MDAGDEETALVRAAHFSLQVFDDRDRVALPTGADVTQGEECRAERVAAVGHLTAQRDGQVGFP